jgi:hypothetical protein
MLARHASEAHRAAAPRHDGEGKLKKHAPPRFYLHHGDTLVCFGDSVTNQRLYPVFTETYMLKRFPQMRVNFFHSGWSGDRTSRPHRS